MTIKELRCSKCNKLLGIFSKVDGTEVKNELRHIENPPEFSHNLEMKCPRCKNSEKLELTECKFR